MTVSASITFDGFPALKPADMRAAGRVAMRAVGEHWVKNYMLLHFQNTAFYRYAATPRNQEYRYWKRASGEINGEQSIGEDRPLVWSGRSRERAKAARVEAKSPSSSLVYSEVIIDAPALNFKSSKSAIDPREELKRVNRQEIGTLTAVLLKAYERELIRMGKMKRRYRKVA